MLDPIFICGHVGPLHGGGRRPTLSYLGKSRKQWSCEVCGTEYQSNIVNYGSEGTAYVVTKWMDLGRGWNQDQDWDRNFDSQETSRGAPIFPTDNRGPTLRWWDGIGGKANMF